MAKKLSVAEMLAAARAEKQGGAAPATPPAPAESPAAEPAVAAPVAATPAEPVAAAPAVAAPAGPKKPASAMSVAEIMAAARAKKTAGEAAPAAAAAPVAPKPAAPKPAAAEKPAAAAKAAPAVAAGPKDTTSILAAARSASKPGPITKAEAAAKAKPVEVAAKKKLEVPPMPVKPAYATAPVATAADTEGRRSFLTMAAGLVIGSPLAIGFTTLAVTHVMWLLGLARYMFPNVLIEPPTRFKVGFPDSLAPGQVETKFIPQFGVWIVRYEYEGQPMIYALKAVCTHLGCTPNWLEAEQKFKCPCHGSGFYKDGINFEGPAPRPLERYAVSIADDGQLQVDKSRTFNQEMGNWTDTASYVPV